MITAKHVHEWLDETPFQPFRIYLSDGSHHDVPHPEFAWLFGSRIFVGRISGSNGHVEESVKQLSLLHVSRIEPLATKRKKQRQHH